MLKTSSQRSGTYIQQPTGYRAFIPAALPPQPKLEIDDEMLSLLSQADRALGRLDGSTEILPNPDLFVFMYVRKEAVLSSQIEGTQASLTDLLELEAQVLEPSRPTDVAEVLNYLNALNHGLKRLEELPVSLRLLKKIHQELMRGVRGGEKQPGEFRRTQNWIGPQNCTLTTARFIPPPPADMMNALGDLERFLHDPGPMPPLIKVGLAHSQFETIHPFLDGNGRVGRLLITFLLCEQQILKLPLLYLSYYFKQNRTEYYDRLQAVRDRGDWEGWMKFFLTGVYEVAQQATRTAQRIVSMREAHRNRVSGISSRRAGSALKLLESLYYQPITTVASATRSTGLSVPNANSLIAQFVEAGILSPVGDKRRNRVFAYREYLDLFDDDELRPGNAAAIDEETLT